MKIALIFNKEAPYTTGTYIERVFKQEGINFQHFWTSQAHTIKPEFDFYLRIDHGDYKYDIPRHLHPSAFYVVDTNLQHSYQKIKEQVRHFDFVFCIQRSAVLEFKSQGINSFWLPIACDAHIHHKLNLRKCYNIGFVGSEGGIPRKFILQELRERFPNSFIGRAPFTEMARIYSQSKIGFHYIKSQTRHTDPISMRFFEVMSCGTMLLTNKIEGESLNMLGFQDKRHLVLYRNISEIFPLIEYYLKNDRQRQEIADRGHKLVLARHTYSKRVKEILDIVNKSEK